MAQQDYANNLTSTLKDLRENSELCDITIIVGKRSFHAHRAVLAASSHYFRGMFSHGFKEGRASEINIDGNPEIFEVLLEYAYTGKMKIMPKLAFDILEMAGYMQFSDICKYFSQVMDLNNFTCPSEKIDMADALRIYQLATGRKDLAIVVEKVMRYLCGNMQDLKKTQEFLETASKSFLDELLSEQNLSCVKAEEEVHILELVVRWLKHDGDNRHVHTLGLLQQIHLGLIPGDSLKEFLDHRFLEIPGCQELLENVLKLQDSGESKLKLSFAHPNLFAARTIFKVPIMLSKDEARDYPESETFKFYYFDTETKEWKYLRYLDVPPQEVTSLFVIGSSLYAVGGRDEQDILVLRGQQYMAKHLFRFDAEQNSWEELPLMNTPRDVDVFPMVYLNGFMYAIGGNGPHDYNIVNDVERFDVVNETWETVAPIPRERDGCCESAVVFEGKILVFVHYCESMASSTKHEILAYDPDSGFWQTAFSKQLGTEECNIIRPVLFLYGNILYRVMYLKPEGSDADYYNDNQCPKVNVLNVHISGNTLRAKEGEEIKQDLIPENTTGAFRIGDEVFLNVNGFVGKTDLKIRKGQSTDVDVDSWKKFAIGRYQTYFINSNIVNFTLDKKLVV